MRKDNQGFEERRHRVFALLLMLLAAGLASCSRTRPAATPSGERSVEERLAELEQRINGDTPRLSEAEAKKQWERDYAEIERLGLVERAYADFSSRLTNSTVETWTIGYLRDTNMVWCDVRYRLPGNSETLQKEFGYQRKVGTNWDLMWRAESK
jgi:hypothetical protein